MQNVASSSTHVLQLTAWKSIAVISPIRAEGEHFLKVLDLFPGRQQGGHAVLGSSTQPWERVLDLDERYASLWKLSLWFLLLLDLFCLLLLSLFNSFTFTFHACRLVEASIFAVPPHDLLGGRGADVKGPSCSKDRRATEDHLDESSPLLSHGIRYLNGNQGIYSLSLSVLSVSFRHYL